MKKISFIILMSLMLFLGVSAAAKTEDLSFDEYTGEALSDDYVEESEDGISTCGAIIIDPGLGGEDNDDVFEMNDTLATATNINSYLSYDSNNKCKFVKYLSISNHSNGKSDVDYFYFTNAYKNKYFSVSIAVSDFFKYYISLYSVQETTNGSKYVYVGNSSEALAYSNLEIGSYIIKFVSRNNTQSSYGITISLERENDSLNQENNSEVTATTIYEGLSKKIKCDGNYKYLKFSSNKRGQFICDLDNNYLQIDSIYRYKKYSEPFSSVSNDLIVSQKIYDNSFCLNSDSADIYYVKLKTNQRGNFNFKISYNNVYLEDNTNITEDNDLEYKQIFPLDDMALFTSIYEQGNMEYDDYNSDKERIIYRFDLLLDDNLSDIFAEGKYNEKSIAKCDQIQNGSIYYVQTNRFAIITYKFNSNGDIIESEIDYLRYDVVYDDTSKTREILIDLKMNYIYKFDFITNTLSLEYLDGDLSLDIFSVFKGYEICDETSNFNLNGISLYSKLHQKNVNDVIEDSDEMKKKLGIETIKFGFSKIPTFGPLSTLIDIISYTNDVLDCYYFVDENSSDTSINYYSDNKYSIVETKHLRGSVCNTTLEKTGTIGKYYNYYENCNYNGNDNSDINVDNDFFFWGYTKNVFYEKYIIRGVQYYICLRANGNNIPIVRMGNIVKGE
mgnify:FL=1